MKAPLRHDLVHKGIAGPFKYENVTDIKTRWTSLVVNEPHTLG
jgi:hypothetical protein